MKEDRVGNRFINSQGCDFIVVEYISYSNCTIKFEDGTTLTNIEYGNIKKGNVRNPNHASFLGIGYMGIGEFMSKQNGKTTKHYETWKNMLVRAYSNKYRLKYLSYKDVTVCEEWHCFQNFAKWFDENREEYMNEWHLDKDILVKGNKIYSPETCCFVPSVINYLFTKREAKRGNLPIGVVFVKISERYQAIMNETVSKKGLGTYDTPEEAFTAYKIGKEAKIKYIAKGWKDLLKPNVYQALINYQVEITD